MLNVCRWFNQWPVIASYAFIVKWIISASIAGCEYAPMTFAFTLANKHNVHLGLMTAYMEALDNFFRMMQQLGLGDPLAWFDWIAALGLALCVIWQGFMHFRGVRLYRAHSAAKEANGTSNPEKQNEKENGFQPLATSSETDVDGVEEEASKKQDQDTTAATQAVSINGEHADAEGESHPLADVHIDDPAQSLIVAQDGDEEKPALLANDPVDPTADLPPRPVFALGLDKERFIIVVIAVTVLVVGSPVVATQGGYVGQAYVLATLATAAKTFAWWINQYPQLKHLSFFKKWMAGWSIAALIEYFPLIGAMTIASTNGVHLGLMTAYMEALDNFFRILQQRLLNKPLAWFDYSAAAGMFVFVIFQGVMRYESDHNNL